MVYILLADGFEEAEALVPADLLRRAGAEVALVGVTAREVTGGHGITVKADLLLEQVERDRMELVLLPGGMGGVEGILASSAALDLVRFAAANDRWVAAICAAPTILAVLGLLEGKEAVCYPGMEDEMAGALVQRGMEAVACGRFITGEAAGSAFPFGLRLVEALCGPQAARQVKEEVHYHHG